MSRRTKKAARCRRAGNSQHQCKASTPRCECGNPTTEPGEPCQRCNELDGTTPIEAEVRRALQQGAKTCSAIAASFDGHYGSVHRALKRMRKAHFVRVVGRQADEQGEVLVYGWRGLPRRSHEGRLPS